MDAYHISLLIAIIIFVILSAFFSSAETAFSCINSIRLKRAAKKGSNAAKRVISITGKYDKMLSSILIGNNIVNIACASVGTILFSSYFGNAGAWISTIVITLVVLMFGEVVPKSIAKANPDSVALAFSGIISFLMIIFTPLSTLLVCLTNLSSKLFKSKQPEPSVTEQELKFIVEEIENEGVLEEQESELVRSALDFDEITVDRIFTPRVDIVSVDVNSNTEDIKNMFLTERYSRVPVYEDNIDNIVGILFEKSFFKSYIINQRHVDIRSVIQPPIFVLPQKKISELLEEFQEKRFHIAIVTDQYGGTLGIVTLEDILEELVGDIWDEDDDIVENITSIENGKYLVNADMSFADLFEELELDPPENEDENASVAAWVLETLEKIPNKGDSFNSHGLTVTISNIEDKRIKSVIIKKDSDVNGANNGAKE